MYKVTYTGADGREITSSINSWMAVINKVTKLALRDKEWPPFPIVVTNDDGEIIYKIKG